MNKYVLIIAKVILSLPMVVFGANKFLNFMETPPPANETIGLFMGAMFGTYLVKLVAITEIVGGLMLWSKKTEVIGALVLIPVTFNIVLLHLFHDIAGLPIGLICFLANLVLLFAAKNKLKALL